MASIIKVDQIQSDSGTVNVSSNLASHNIVSGTTNHIRMFDTRSSTGVGTMIGANQDGNTYYDSNYNNTATAGGHVFRGAGSELATITSSGRLNLPYGQITFPASQNASSDANTLDDYEEGLWTPTITGFSSGFSSVTYSAQQGKYVKIGRLVCCQGYVNWSSKSGGSGVFCISGLPFSTYDTGGTSVPNFQEYNGFTFTSRTQLGGEIFSNIIYFIASGTAVTPYSVAVSDVASSGYTYMWFSYMTT